MTASELNEYSKLRDRVTTRIDAIQSALLHIKRIAATNMDEVSFGEPDLAELRRIERDMNDLSGILDSIIAL